MKSDKNNNNNNNNFVFIEDAPQQMLSTHVTFAVVLNQIMTCHLNLQGNIKRIILLENSDFKTRYKKVH